LAWAHVKREIGKLAVQTEMELKAAAKRTLKQLQKVPDIVTAFFYAPTCAYAKACSIVHILLSNEHYLRALNAA